MVRQRESQAEQQAKKVQAFVSSVEKTNLKSLSLDELAHRFEDIEQQAQLMQGQILLEARNRFASDNDFGTWIEYIGGAICSTSRQHRTRLMNLARFFEGRELDKISISAAYEISAPVNKDIAEEIYESVRGKNMPLAEVRRQIALKKGVPNTSIIPVDDKPVVKITTKEVETISTNLVNNSTELSLEQKIMQLVENEIPQAAIVALKNVIDELNKKRYKK